MSQCLRDQTAWVCLLLLAASAAAADGWPMPGADPQRTSWVKEELRGQLTPVWYRPIEPYISQNVQIIASDGLLFLATARGLYALRADDGDLAWVYPTDMPLGHSPTIHQGVAYVGGFDRRLHAVDAKTGKRLWVFDEAGAGFRTNSLVADGLVMLGNRDGQLYAVHAHGTPQAGKLAWKFTAGGPIFYSAAYHDGIVYFAANDMHAYALDARTGKLVWKSAKLPGAGFHSWWPVVWQDKVVFAGSMPAYRDGARPGTLSVKGNIGGKFVVQVEGSTIFGKQVKGYLGPTGTDPGDWAKGTTTLDMTRAIDYLRDHPWRRTLFVLERATGKEYTFDHNGKPAFAPFLYAGTMNGNRFPPAVGPDGVLYAVNMHSATTHIPRGQVTGWTAGKPCVSIPNPLKTNAIDEPMAIAGGGKLLYWSLCCDREGGGYDITSPGTRAQWQYLGYNLGKLCPGYDAMWAAVGDQDGTGNRLWGAYGSNNGIYHNHTNDQNPFVPYRGKLYIHRSNCVIAFGPAGGRKSLPLVKTSAVPDETLRATTPERLRERLAAEVRKMLAAGHLRPGYFNGGQFWSRPIWGDRHNDYFIHPGDTIWALTRALPHLPDDVKERTKAYLQKEFADYPPHKIALIGWKDGAGREAFDLPPEVQADLVNYPPSPLSDSKSWRFPPHALYALWKFAEVQGGAEQLYNESKGKLEKPPADPLLIEFPYVANAFIAGHVGWLNLEKLAGKPESKDVAAELTRLLKLRADTFTKDTPWTDTRRGSHIKRMSVYRNFLYLVPELAGYLREHARDKVQACLDEIDRVAPYWFVTHYEGCLQESTIHNLNDYNAVFQARAWIMQEPRERLDRYLDVPAFAVGDLFYLHQLVSLLEAPISKP